MDFLINAVSGFFHTILDPVAVFLADLWRFLMTAFLTAVHFLMDAFEGIVEFLRWIGNLMSF